MKDPKQFRERFKKWKEGTPIEEIYDNGRPTYFESVELLASPMAKNWTNIKEEFKPSAKYVGNTYSGGKDDRTYIGGSSQELVVTPGKSWVNPYTGEYTRATESYAQPIASKDPYVDYQFYSPTGNSIVQTINSTPRWQQYWADQEGNRVSNAIGKAAPIVLDLLMSADAAARLPELALEIPEIYKAVKYGAQQGLRRISPSYDLYKTIGETAPKAEVINPTIRTKLGDVEIDNPGLAYRQGNDIGRTYVKYKNIDNSAAQFQIENNLDQIIAKRKNTPYVSKESILDDAIKNGKWTPEGGVEGNNLFYQDTPMYADGYLWYGAPKINETLDVGALNSGLLVSPKNNNFIVGSSKATPYRRTGTGILHSDGVTYVTDNLGRLIPSDVGNLGLNLNEIEAFTWKPGYGYKRVVSDVPAIEWAEATRTPKITAENAANITPEQWTAAQDAAIARGDMAEAQRLRDLHFQVSAPTPYISKGVYLPSGSQPTISQADYYNGNNDLVTLYHSSVDADNLIKEGFDGVERGLGRTKGEAKGTIFASANPDYAADYSNLYVQEGYSTPDKVGLIELKVPRGAGTYEGSEVRLRPEHIKQITKSAYEKTPWLKWLKTRKTDNSLFNIKSADAVTYDNNGVRIPLGLRDNFKLNDIRYGLIPLGFGLGAATLPNKYARGKDSGIYIKPSKRGTFTAAAKKRGMSVLSFASKVLNNPSNYSKAMRKKALFAKNASKFKH